MTTQNGEAGQGQQADAAEALTARLRRDMVGALELFTVYLGERLGLYRALAADRPATSAARAGRGGGGGRGGPGPPGRRGAAGVRRPAGGAAGPPVPAAGGTRGGAGRP